MQYVVFFWTSRRKKQNQFSASFSSLEYSYFFIITSRSLVPQTLLTTF